MAKFHRARVSAVLAADAELDVRPRRPPGFDRHPHHRAHALAVQHRERIGVEDVLRFRVDMGAAALADHLFPVHLWAQTLGTGVLPLHVERHELRRVVTREAEGRLRQVVGAEREELRLLGDAPGRHGGPRQLDHRADQIGQLDPVLLQDLVGDLADQVLLRLHLRHHPDQRDHDLGDDLLAFPRDFAGRFQNRPRLHPGDLGHRDPQPAAPEPEHRIELVQLLDPLQQAPFLFDDLRLPAGQLQFGDLHHQLLAVRKELVERRIEEADGDGIAFHLPVESDEVLTLKGQELLEVPFALLPRPSEDHLLHDRDPVLGEEHVLRPTETDAFGAEPACDARLIRHVGVRPHLERAHLVGPFEERREDPVLLRALGIQLPLDDLDDLRLDDRDVAVVDIARKAVDREIVAFLERQRADADGGAVLHVHRFTAGDAHLSHLPGHDRGVGRHPAPGRQEALRRVHAVNVVGAGLLPHQQDALAPRVHLDGPIGGQGDLAGRRPGSRRQPLADRRVLGLLRHVEDGIEVLRELIRADSQDGLPLRDQPLVHHVVRDPDGRDAGPLSDPRLQHVELALLDRELQVEHVAVVLFELLVRVDEALVRLREGLRQRGHRERGPDARHHVLPLRVEQELAEERLLPGRGIARERHPGSARVPHVPEDHRDDAHRRAPAIRDVVETSIRDRAGAIP